MSLAHATKNKMMGEAPAKKGHHFARTEQYEAMFVEGSSIEEAQKKYHKNRTPIPVEPTAQSTGAPEAGAKEGVN
jgi:hypothetical protein